MDDESFCRNVVNGKPHSVDRRRANKCFGSSPRGDRHSMLKNNGDNAKKPSRRHNVLTGSQNNEGNLRTADQPHLGLWRKCGSNIKGNVSVLPKQVKENEECWDNDDRRSGP